MRVVGRFGPAARATRPEHPSSPAPPGLLRTMPGGWKSMLPTTPSYPSGQLQQTVWGCQTRRAWQPGLSLLTPTHLHCLSTSTGHLPCYPYPSSNHHILLTISPKSHSAFQHPARVSARFSNPCGSTGCPLRQLPSPYIPASTAADHPSRLYTPAPSTGVQSCRLVHPRRSEGLPAVYTMGISGRGKPSREGWQCKGPQSRAKACQRPPCAAAGTAGGI